MKKLFYVSGLLFFMGCCLFTSCVPKEDIQFKSVRDIGVETDEKGEPILRGNAVFYNPNKVRMKLRKVNMEIKVNDKTSALVRQEYNMVIPSRSDFVVPVVANLSLKEIGLLDAVMGLFGGKKYKIQFLGTIYASVNGVRVKVPVNYTEEMRLKF